MNLHGIRLGRRRVAVSMISGLAVLGLPWTGPSHANELVIEGGSERIELTTDNLDEVAVDDMEAGGAMLLIALKAVESARFSDMTERLVGQAITLTVCGRELARFVVQERIDNAVIVLPLTDRAEAETYARALSGDAVCPS